MPTDDLNDRSTQDRPVILIVDDIENNRAALAEILRRDDCELLHARSGPEALELLLSREVALALVDVQMPEMDGFELAELLRGVVRTKSIPLMFVTAGLEDRQRSFRGYEVGAVDFLFKPIEPEVLRSKVNVFLDVYRQRKELTRQRDALRDSEARYRSIVSQTIGGIAEVDGTGLFQTVNDRYCAIVGYRREELVGRMRMQEITHPDDLRGNLELFQRLVAGGPAFEIEKRYVRKDGSLVWVHNSVSAIADGNGKTKSVVSVVMDVTDRRRAEEALRGSERRYRTLVQQVKDYAIFRSDREGRAISWNEGVRSVLGFTEEEFLGVDIAPVIFTPEALAAGVPERELRAAAETGSAGNDRWMRRKNGERFWAIGMTTALHDDRGHLIGFTVVMRDRTAAKLDELLLAEHKQLLERIATNRPMKECLHTLTDSVTRLQPTARAALLIADANHAAMIDGVSVHLPSSIGEAVGGAPIDELSVGICGDAIHAGLPVTCPDIEGSRHWSSMWRDLCLAHGIKACHSQPVFGHEGKAIASFFLCLSEAREPNDWERRIAEFGAHVAGVVLERDRAERALCDAQDRLQRWNLELEQAVDVKTTELVQSEGRLRALAAELNLAEQQERKRLATELHDHLQQMLVLGRIKLGQGKRFTESVPVWVKLIEEIDEIFSQALTYTRTLVTELSPPVLRDHGLAAGLKWLAEYMKKHDMTVAVAADDDDVKLAEDQTVLLFQSVRELLINSWKYAGTGEASVIMQQVDGHLRITVRDDGQGFDLAAAAAAAADSPTGGLSSKFGLFSIRERMRAMGGSFNIESAPGTGTTTTLTLPLGSVRSPNVECSMLNDEFTNKRTASSDRSTLNMQHSTLSSTRIRVLLVDDHAMMRQGLRSLLESYDDVEVVGEASNGEEAVRAVERLSPRVVIMDINMPKKNGIEGTAEIKGQYPDIRVIGLSVNADGDNQSAMVKAGASTLLTKEVAVEQLYGVIQEAVGKQ
jgi:PAS domain S-box-containing protein